MLTWVIKDLPGDQVAIDDGTIILPSSGSIFRDVVWRADHFNLYDMDQPDPYAPIYDWNNYYTNASSESMDQPNPYAPISEWDDSYNDMPHIPYSSYYLDPLIIPYTAEQLQQLNPFLYCAGYDWRYLKDDPLIVRGEPFQPYYDYDPDKVEAVTESIAIDALDHICPSHAQLELIDEYNQSIEDLQTYIKVYKETVPLDSHYNTYIIEHNLDSEDVFVTLYDVDSGNELHCDIKVLNTNKVQLTFNISSILKHGISNVRVLIMAPTSEPVRAVSGRTFELIDYNILPQQYYMLLSDMNSKDVAIEAYQKESRSNVQFGFKRHSDNVYYVTLKRSDAPILYSFNQKYKVNLIHAMDETENDLPRETLFKRYTYSNITEPFVIEHNFPTNNILVQVYDANSNEQVYPLIIKGDSNTEPKDLDKPKRIIIDFGNKADPDTTYKVLILGIVEKFYKYAVPLNNISGYSGSIICDASNNTLSYVVEHNLNTFSTFEQLLDKDTGEYVACSFNRIDENHLEITLSESYIQEHPNKELSVIIIASFNLDGDIYPSTIYNTAFRSYKVTQYKSSDTTFTINHNMNNANVIVQVYNKNNIKVNAYVKIVDLDSIEVSMKNVSFGDSYLINILSLPDQSKAFINYNAANADEQAYSFITMYEQIIKNNDLKDDLSNTYIGGTSADDFEECYIGGDSTSKYRDVIIHGGKSDTGMNSNGSTFTIQHNLNTTSVIVNLYNENTKETIDCYVAINNPNSVTIEVLQDIEECLDDFHVLIVGALENTIQAIDNKERFDLDSIPVLPAYGYKEFKTKLNPYDSYHVSYYTNLYDMPQNNIYELSEITGRKLTYSLQKYGLPSIQERVDIYHEIQSPYSDSNITYIHETETEINGFNRKDILTNMPLWANQDVPSEPTLETYNAK